MIGFQQVVQLDSQPEARYKHQSPALAVGDDCHRRSEDVKKFAVRNIDQEDEAWNHMRVPEKIGIDFNISKELGQEVTAEGNPIVGTDRREVGHIIAGLNDFGMSHAIPFNEKAGKF